ncbi:MAG: FMN-binding negative transcriptional regulator [Gemmatimonadaceae bacterium]
MYIPPSNAEHDQNVIFDFIQGNPFGALVTVSADGLLATHIPLVLDRTRGAHGALEGHIARANPQHSEQLTAPESLIIFSGPDAYITPTWYPTKQEHGKVVPTWNYVAVHAYGLLTFTDDAAFLLRHLEQLTGQQETGRDPAWAVSDAPADFIAQQARAIVGFEFAITRLEGKWKMSQNRSDADIDGVIGGLGKSAVSGDLVVADIVASRRPTFHSPGQ